MREIVTAIDVAAAPDIVWKILTDFGSYPEWNPFIPEVVGAAVEGTRLAVRIEPPGGKAMTFRPTILRVAQPGELRWLGRLLLPGLFDGEHIFQIEETADGGVRLHHREQFSGLLVPLFWNAMSGPTQKGFEAMNTALKERAEDGAG